jgi:hypothetical protein
MQVRERRQRRKARGEQGREGLTKLDPDLLASPEVLSDGKGDDAPDDSRPEEEELKPIKKRRGHRFSWKGSLGGDRSESEGRQEGGMPYEDGHDDDDGKLGHLSDSS